VYENKEITFENQQKLSSLPTHLFKEFFETIPDYTLLKGVILRSETISVDLIFHSLIKSNRQSEMVTLLWKLLEHLVFKRQ